MAGLRIALPLIVTLLWAATTLMVMPHSFEAESLLAAQDDPVQLTDHLLDRSFDAAIAEREMRSALAANDADLAQSFRDLARDRNVPVDSSLAIEVERANSMTVSAVRAAGSFGRGLISGEPDDLAGLAGTALGDLFVFGDIRDALREGSRLATGQHADELILGLACVGIAVTAGTYASFGAGTPVRAGLSLAKAARKSGRMTILMSEWFGRSLREIVDLPVLRSAIGGATLSQPALAVRSVREAVKIEKARDLTRLLGDMGRVQSKAGTKAALDGLKIAEGPRDISRIARLAETKGTRTRALLKMFGRGAIWLTAGAFNLFSWLLGAILAVFGFCSACKSMVERATEGYLHYRKSRRSSAVPRFAPVPVHA
jgi:hypothetical protein